MRPIDYNPTDVSDGAYQDPWYPGEIHYAYQGDRLLIAYLELGLRWLNDRSQDDKRRNKSRAWQDPSGRWFG